MKKAKTIGSVVAKIATNFLLAVLLFVAVSQFIEINVLACAGMLSIVSVTLQIAVLAAGGKTKTNKFAYMALQQEIWVPFIQENLFPKSSFLELAEDHSQFIQYKTVHLPQAGATPGMVMNNTSVPLSITQRSDTDFTYDINNYKLVPTAITDLEELQINYSKRNSILGNYFRMAGYGIANSALYSWAPTGSTRMVRTTGTATANALAPGATGTRNAITLADIAALKDIMDADFVPEEDRYIIIPSSIYNNQLLAINNIQAFYAYNRPVLQDAEVRTIFGFKVIVKPSVVVYDNSGTPVIKSIITDTSSIGGYTFGTPVSTASTDNMAIVAFHKSFVGKAQSDIKIFGQQDRPEYYGSIFSAELQFGSSALYANGIGTAVLVQQ